MRAKRRRQIKRTESEWQAIIEKHSKSGLTIREFCGRHNLVMSTFKRWQKTLEKAPAQFVDLSPAAASVSTTPWELAVTLPNGVRLQFRG